MTMSTATKAATTAAKDAAAATAAKGAAAAETAKAKGVAAAEAAKATATTKAATAAAKVKAAKAARDLSVTAKDWSEAARDWSEPRAEAARAWAEPRLAEATARVRDDVTPRVTAALLTALESSQPTRDEALRRASTAVAALRGESLSAPVASGSARRHVAGRDPTADNPDNTEDSGHDKYSGRGA
ncbi:MAG: hypothetical protein ACTHMW_01570, partial [Actinomycetes bacterium]